MFILGALAIILGCGSMGLYQAWRIRKRPQELRSCSTALSLLDTEIYWGSTPLPEAFAAIGERADEPWQRFFVELADRLARGESAGRAWNQVIEEQQGRFCLKNEDWFIIRDVGKGLGRSDRREQHKQLDRVQKQLGETREQAAEWAEKQSKLWSYMGFLMGMAGVIFLV